MINRVWIISIQILFKYFAYVIKWSAFSVRFQSFYTQQCKKKMKSFIMPCCNLSPHYVGAVTAMERCLTQPVTILEFWKKSALSF